MTVKELTEASELRAVTVAEPDREICGAYVCDLLSWVIGRAEADSAWITIMSNINVPAVATLADVSCVILAEGVVLDEDALAAAEARGINVLSSPLPTYETAILIRDMLK